MSPYLLAVLTFGLGVGVAWRYFLPWRGAREHLDRRSRVLYQLAEGDRENVARELERVCEGQPGDATMFLALAALDRERGRVDRAKAIHRTVLAAADLPAEERVAALVGLGRDLLAQGNERAAVGALVRAVSLAPRSVATLETLAKALERAGAWERAAATWERLQRQVEGRRAREARTGRGHAVAGQALDALDEGDTRKARRLAERAIDLAPESAHAWTVRARVESHTKAPENALEAWQRAWELCPAGAHMIVPEAWDWASAEDRQEDLVERMLATLRIAQAPELVVALAERVARQHPDQAVTALDRVSERSHAAQLALVRLHLARGQRDAAREAGMRKAAAPSVRCGACGAAMRRFSFRCENCGQWEQATVGGAGRVEGAGRGGDRAAVGRGVQPPPKLR